VVYVPLTFWRDHAARQPYEDQQAGPTPLHYSGQRVAFSARDPGLPFLLADARYYAKGSNMDECPRHVRESAKRAVAALAQVSP
jgi:hypothetical protein